MDLELTGKVAIIGGARKAWEGPAPTCWLKKALN